MSADASESAAEIARQDARQDALRVATFHTALLAAGKSETVAAELTVAYVLGLLRRPDPEPWERQ
jgi:hypothetical protein